MRKWTKNKSTVVGLALASTVALTLGTVLPLTIRPGSASNNTGQSRSELINALKPTTSYDVGSPLRLELSEVPNINYASYTFDWYMGTSPENARLYQSTTAPKVQLTDLGENMNGAYIYCVLVPMTTGSESNFYGLNDASSRAVNVTYYAQTQLKLDHQFAIESCEITVASSSFENKVIYDNDVALVPQNTALSLEAFISNDAPYEQYVVYQWFCNGHKLENQTAPILNITADQLHTGNEYTCEAKLVAGSVQSGVVESNPILINVVSSTSLQGYTPTILVNGTVQNKPEIDEGSKVQLDARFTLGLNEITTNNDEYRVTYQWLKDNKIYQQGNNSSTLIFDSIQPTDAGSYSCIAYLDFVHGGSLMCVSPAAIVNAVAPGVITIPKNLTDTTIINGQGIDLSIMASLKDNDSSLKYVWYYQAPNGNWIQANGVTGTSLKLTPQQAYEGNGYKFKCEISAPDQQNVTPVTTNIMTLTVQNPSFTVKLTSTPTNTSNLPYGSDLTLSATVSNNTPTIPNNNFKVQFGYQWMSSSDNKNWTTIKGATQSTLELEDLSSKNNEQYYKCIVYPTNAIQSTQQSLMQSTNSTQVTIQNFSFNVTADFANETNGTSPITNNLGDTYSLNTNVKLSNYQNLPNNYSYTYTWQTTVSPTPSSNDWVDVNSITGANPSNCTANNAGRHYFRCVVGIVDNANPSQVLATAFSNTLEMNTYPKLQLSTSSPTIVIPHNASQTIEPDIGIITTLNPALSLFKAKTTVPTTPGESLDQELQACGACYQWTKNGQDITPSDVANYPYIINNSCHTRILKIDSALDTSHETCTGQYNLIVTINGIPYQLQEPITVTEADPTFKVTASASAYVTGNSINLSAQVNPINSNGENSNFESSDYQYYWYLVSDNNEGTILTPIPVTTSNYTLTIESGEDVQKYMDYKFACKVLNINTQEVEYSNLAELVTNNPVYCQIQGNTNVIEGNTITLTATSLIEGQPVNSTNQDEVSYTWQYYDPRSYSWKTVQPTKASSSNGAVTIQNQNGQSILTLSDPTIDYSQLVFKCTATYGQYSSSANQEILVSLTSSTISLSQVQRAMFNLQEVLSSQETMQWFVENTEVKPNSPYAVANPALKQFILEYLGYGNQEIQNSLFKDQDIYITQKIWGLNFLYITIPLVSGQTWNITKGNAINTGSVLTNTSKTMLTFMIGPSLIVGDSFVPLSSSYQVTKGTSNQLNINKSSNDNTLSASVNVSFNKPNITDSLNNVIWYACYKPWSPAYTYNEQFIELTNGTVSGNAAKLFGSNANIQITTNANSSSIQITGVSGSQFNSLPAQSNLYLFAVASSQNKLYNQLEWNYNGDYSGYSRSGMQITFTNSPSSFTAVPTNMFIRQQ